MSRDSQYRHRLWHAEDPTLSVRNPRLELLVDFDPPAQFALPQNCSQLHGIRPSFVVSATPGAPTGGDGKSGGVNGDFRGVGVFGKVSRAACDKEDPMVTQWRELGVPPMVSE